MVVLFIGFLLEVVGILIIIRAILTWLPDVASKYRSQTLWLDKATEPLLKPFRRILPSAKTGGTDFSPMAAIIALQIVKRLLFTLS